MNQVQWQSEAMAEALALAELAAAEGESPVGAVVADREGRIIGRGRNRRESGDPLGHAELFAIAEAARAIGDWRLEGTTMIVTLEPCAMCAGALVNARVERLIFAARDPKAGFCGSLGNLVQDPRLNHRLDVESGLMEERSRELLQDFFRKLRQRDRTERWQSGCMRRSRKPLYLYGYRGFESPLSAIRARRCASRIEDEGLRKW